MALVCLCAVTGCGGADGPEKFTVEGTVTLAGNPVPGGNLYFRPDTSKGNSGPMTTGLIKDGEFLIPPEVGVVEGPSTVSVEVRERQNGKLKLLGTGTREVTIEPGTENHFAFDFEPSELEKSEDDEE